MNGADAMYVKIEQKLFRVITEGLGSFYVVSENPAMASKRLEEYLKYHGISFDKNRRIVMIEILAEEAAEDGPILILPAETSYSVTSTDPREQGPAEEIRPKVYSVDWKEQVVMRHRAQVLALNEEEAQNRFESGDYTNHESPEEDSVLEVFDIKVELEDNRQEEKAAKTQDGSHCSKGCPHYQFYQNSPEGGIYYCKRYVCTLTADAATGEMYMCHNCWRKESMK